MGFRSEGEDASLRAKLRHRGEDWRQLVHINENIRGNDEIVFCFAARLLLKKIDKVGAFETVVEIFCCRFDHHRFRKIDADQPTANRTKRGPGKPRPAAEVEGRL